MEKLKTIKNSLIELAPLLGLVTAFLTFYLPTTYSGISIIIFFCFLTSFSYHLRVTYSATVFVKLDRIIGYLWLGLTFLNIFILFKVRN